MRRDRVIARDRVIGRSEKAKAHRGDAEQEKSSKCFYVAPLALSDDLHPATRSARQGPRACGARKYSFQASDGTTSQPSIPLRKLRVISGNTLKSCPDTCISVDAKSNGSRMCSADRIEPTLKKRKDGRCSRVFIRGSDPAFDKMPRHG